MDPPPPPDLAAGAFSTWLASMQAALRGEIDAAVPCGSCTACCTSSQFVTIEPDETDTLSRIPPPLRFPAPGRPKGHVVLGYDGQGHCAMFRDGACSIYEHRPRACRMYDCRVFPASGIEPTDLEKAAIAERARRWVFAYPSPEDERLHAAVRAAAQGLEGAARSDTERAVLAVQSAGAGPADPEGAAVTIRRLDAQALDGEMVGTLAGILVDCVDGGASVSFMAPLDRARAEAFWAGVRAGVEAGTTILLVAHHRGEVAGTVQVQLAWQENQPHRGEIAKLLVHRRARRLGLAEALMAAAEAHARAAGRTLLILDTVRDSDADRLYRRLGWTAAGTIPDYALHPDGRLADTVIFWKRI